MLVNDNLTRIKQGLLANVTLVAVSKRHPKELIQEAYDGGHRDFGENMVQEMQEKHDVLPSDIKWHLIGHLQRNKVKYIVDYIHLIHGVDSLRLLEEINKRAANIDRVVSCLLQVHIANEDTKFGFDESELISLLNDLSINNMNHIRILGLMGMATNTENQDQIRSEFEGLELLFKRIQQEVSHPQVEMKYLSMGMSGDYELAMECGSNMVRVGSLIFGTRHTK